MTEAPPFIKVACPQIDESDVAAVGEALLSGQLTSGPKVAAFETAFAAYIGTDHAVAVNSGTAALHAALAAAGLGPGDEVIVPALTFFSTVTSVIHQGAVPVFCDISIDNFCMLPRDLERRITPRTKALIPVHYLGHAAEMDDIMAIARRHGLFVVEDCAQAHGTRYKGSTVGAIGHAGAFSMFATKHMTTCEGGMVTTDDPDKAAFIRSFRSHGMQGRNDHVTLGYNYRMAEPLGALGLNQLARLSALNSRRIAISEAIVGRIGDIPWLTVPSVPDYVRHTYFWCHILIDEAALGMDTPSLIATLRDNGVEVRSRYVEPLNKQPLLTRNIPPILRLSAGENLPDYANVEVPNARRVTGSIIGLPNRPDMTEAEIDRVSEVLHNI